MPDEIKKASTIQELHKKACDDHEMTYADPTTGRQVLTGYFLKKRGHCCKTGCRHCPYNFKGKPKE